MLKNILGLLNPMFSIIKIKKGLGIFNSSPFFINTIFLKEDYMDLMTVLSEIGFPALVTMYLLVRIEGKLQELSNSIISLSNNISKMNS